MTVAAKPVSSTRPGQLENELFSVRCPCAASPACLVLLWASETVPRVHLKAPRMAVRDAPANADITPIPNLQFVHRESSGRRSDESSRPEITTGFFCYIM